MARPTIRRGDSGGDVRACQFLLAERKFLSWNQIDGAFGPLTEARVRDFQQGAGLVADGIVGPLTWSSLSDGFQVPPVLRRGDTSPDVTLLQGALAKLPPGGGRYSGPLDGDFGPLTEAAVKQFQGPGEDDGIVGLRTWARPVGAAGLSLAGAAGIHDRGV
jgi:peptidoglycan hydrolase-like protein with peptidoglycan-binding domain